MPAYESKHLLRVLDATPQSIASNFAAYCKQHNVATRGLCKIGAVRRRVPGTAATAPLRGLIAKKDLNANENVVMLPVSACLHPGSAFSCSPFMQLLPPDAARRFSEVSAAHNRRLVERGLIRDNQLLLGLYITYLVLLRAMQKDSLQELQGGDAIRYIDFFPRDEGNFEQLSMHLSGWLDTSEVSRHCQNALAAHFQIAQAEVRPVVVFALCMIYSRMVPVDHRQCLQYAFQRTPYAAAWDDVSATAPLEALPCGNSSSAGVSESVAGGDASKSLVREPISFLCPIIDMCNHSAKENVAVMVPDREPAQTGPVICLRTLRPVKAGEELTMAYGGGPRELKLIWGMHTVLE